jgi:hypothetical protein
MSSRPLAALSLLVLDFSIVACGSIDEEEAEATCVDLCGDRTQNIRVEDDLIECVCPGMTQSACEGLCDELDLDTAETFSSGARVGEASGGLTNRSGLGPDDGCRCR